MSVDEFRLGGVTPVPWLSLSRLVALISLGGLGAVVMVAIVITKSLLLVLVLGVLVGIFMMLARRRASDGGLWILKVGNTIRRWVGVRARWDDFDPEREEQPFLILGPFRVVGVPAGDGSELGVLDDGRGMVVVLEVSGAPCGVMSDEQINRWQEAWTDLHRELADPKTALTQVDWLTLVRPEDPFNIAEQIPDLIPGLPEEAVLSAVDLSFEVAACAEQQFTYAVLRFDVDALYERFVRPPYTAASGAEGAYDATTRVAKLITGADAGISVKSGLSPQEISALIRAIVAPEYSPRNLDDCTGEIFQSCPAWKRDGGMLTVSSDNYEWWHMSASFGLEDWPRSPVSGRWLQPLVFNPDLGCRTIVTQLRLVPTFRATEFARSQLTTARSKALQTDERGTIDAGEAWSRERVATEVAEDVVQYGQVGIVPSVRILLTGTSQRGVRNQFEDLESAVRSKARADGITSDQARPGAALLRVLPLGLEVPAR